MARSSQRQFLHHLRTHYEAHERQPWVRLPQLIHLRQQLQARARKLGLGQELVGDLAHLCNWSMQSGVAELQSVMIRVAEAARTCTL